jgi:manganese/iron transport system substrate-binding protein
MNDHYVRLLCNVLQQSGRVWKGWPDDRLGEDHERSEVVGPGGASAAMRRFRRRAIPGMPGRGRRYKRHLKNSALIAVALLSLFASACSGGNDSLSEGGKLRVVTTVSPITNLVQNVGGDRVVVTGLVPEGQSSHEFEPAPSDARVLADADIVFVNGLNLDLPSIKLARASLRSGAELVELGPRTIKPEEYIFDFSFPRDEGDPNPHLWTNPKYARRYAEVIRDTLVRRDPGGAAEYRGNFAIVAARYDMLDAAVREATATVPAGKRKLLTYHDSFPYFAREYGWKVIGAIQPSDFSDPSPRDIARLIDQVRAEKVPAIFGSEVFPSPVLRQIASESGARYVNDLRDDDLPGRRGDVNHSLPALLVFDYTTIVKALGGNPAAFDRIDTSNLGGEDNATYRD